MEKNSLKCKKCMLEQKVEELKGMIRPDELKEINKLYGKYIPTTMADINMIKSYKNFLQSYVNAKYQHKQSKESKESD